MPWDMTDVDSIQGLDRPEGHETNAAHTGPCQPGFISSGTWVNPRHPAPVRLSNDFGQDPQLRTSTERTWGVTAPADHLSKPVRSMRGHVKVEGVDTLGRA